MPASASPVALRPPKIAVAWRKSMRTRIALQTVSVVFALLLVVLATSALVTRHLTLEDAKRAIRSDAQLAARSVDDVLRVITITCNGIAQAALQSDLTPLQLVSALRAMVETTPGAIGALLAMETAQPGGQPFALRVAVVRPVLQRHHRWHLDHHLQQADPRPTRRAGAGLGQRGHPARRHEESSA